MVHLIETLDKISSLNEMLDKKIGSLRSNLGGMLTQTPRAGAAQVHGRHTPCRRASLRPVIDRRSSPTRFRSRSFVGPREFKFQ